jgi:hypothetical protein
MGRRDALRGPLVQGESQLMRQAARMQRKIDLLALIATGSRSP